MSKRGADQICGLYTMLDAAGRAQVARYVLADVMEGVWGRLTVERMTQELVYELRDRVRDLEDRITADRGAG